MVVLNPGDESWGNDGFRSWPRYRPYPYGMVKHLRTDFNRVPNLIRIDNDHVFDIAR